MKDVLRKATDTIVGSTTDGADLPILTQCAVEIATIALTAYKDKLRRKALNIASAIVDFEDELNCLATVKE